MGSGSGGGTNTITSANPPPQFMAAYQNVVQQAQNAAATPYQAYPGGASSLVAPFSPDQLSGMSAVQNAQGIANPYINAGAQFLGNATAPLWPSTQQFSPNAVSQYESPYTQQVVGSTEQQFANTNAQQQNQLAGSAASQGALGGDRLGVAQGVMAGQQQAAEAPVLAGLQNQGYSQALGEFNTQQQAQLGANEANSWLNSQAGFGMAGLDTQAQNSALTGANALMSTGAQQQALAQENLNIPYQQFVAQQAYPFQTTGWLGGLSEGLGSAAGGTGTSSTSYPAPPMAGQIAGGLATGVGALGATGAFGNAGWLSNAFSGGSGAAAAASGAAPILGGGIGYTARGGAVRSRASGGAIPHRAFGGMLGVQPIMQQVSGRGAQSATTTGGGTSSLSNDIGLAGNAVKLARVAGSMFPAAAPAGLAAAPATAADAGGITISVAGPGTLAPVAASGAPAAAGAAGATGTGLAAASGAAADTAATVAPAVAASLGTAGAAAGLGTAAAEAAPMFLALMQRGGSIPHRASGGISAPAVSYAAPTYAGEPAIPMLATPSAAAGGLGASPGPAVGGIPAGLAQYLSQVAAQAPTQAQLSALTAPTGTLTAQAQQSAINAAVAQALAANPAPAAATAQSPYVGYAGGNKRGGPVHRAAGGLAPPDGNVSLGAPQPDPNAEPAPADQGAEPDAGPGFADRMARSPWTALMDVGAGIMGGRSPYLGENIGTGIQSGLANYERGAQTSEGLWARVQQARAQLKATQSYHGAALGLRQQQVQNQETTNQARLQNEEAARADADAYRHDRIGLAGASLGQRQTNAQASVGARRSAAIGTIAARLLENDPNAGTSKAMTPQQARAQAAALYDGGGTPAAAPGTSAPPVSGAAPAPAQGAPRVAVPPQYPLGQILKDPRTGKMVRLGPGGWNPYAPTPVPTLPPPQPIPGS